MMYMFCDVHDECAYTLYNTCTSCIEMQVFAIVVINLCLDMYMVWILNVEVDILKVRNNK